LVQALAAFNQPEARAALEALSQDASAIVATAADQHLVVEGG
jgi:hypothetical protein